MKPSTLFIDYHATTTGGRLDVEICVVSDLTDFLQESSDPVWGLEALPQTDLVPESVKYFKVDAMGLDFMRNTYTALYVKGNVEVKTFLSHYDSPESAKAIVSRYKDYANAYGEEVERQNVNGVELVSCDMGENYDIVIQKGQLVGGVLDVKDRDLAIQVAIDLWREL